MYTFTAVRWGRDIEEVRDTWEGIVERLDYWLVWDEEGGYMRCAPKKLTAPSGKEVGMRELYAYSHGNETEDTLYAKLTREGGA
jgi:hypothetical protein